VSIINFSWILCFLAIIKLIVQNPKSVFFCYRASKSLNIVTVKWQNKVEKRDFPAVELKNKILVGKDQFEYYKDELIILPTGIFLLMI